MSQEIQFVTAEDATNATAWTGIPESLNFTVLGLCADGGASIVGAIAIGLGGIGFDECVIGGSSVGAIAISFTDIIPLDASSENFASSGFNYTLPANVANATNLPAMTPTQFTIAGSSDNTWSPMISGTVDSLCAQGQQNFIIGNEFQAYCLETKTVVEGAVLFSTCVVMMSSLLGAESIARCAAEWNGCQLTRTPPPPPPPIVPPPFIPPPTPEPTFGHGLECEVYFYKHPLDVLDYTLDWGNWIDAGDSILASAWGTDAGLTIVSSTVVGNKTIVTLSGGTDGVNYTLRNSVATTLGLIDLRTAQVTVMVCHTTPPDPPALARLENFRVFVKNPATNTDIQISWSDYLAVGDALNSSSWTADPGVTLSGNTFSATSATVRVAGGVSLSDYKLTNTVTTQQGRTDVRHVLVQVRVC